MVFLRSLGDSSALQFRRTLLSILADFNDLNDLNFSSPFSFPDSLEAFTIIVMLSLDSFSHQRLLMVIHRSLSDNKSPQVSGTLFSILADLNNVVV